MKKMNQKLPYRKIFAIAVVLLLAVTIIAIITVYFFYDKIDYTHYTYGEVISCTTNSLVVREYNQSENAQAFFVFTVDEDTILCDAEETQIEFKDIRPGMHICVSYPFSISRCSDYISPPRTDIIPSSMQLIEQ